MVNIRQRWKNLESSQKGIAGLVAIVALTLILFSTGTVGANDTYKAKVGVTLQNFPGLATSVNVDGPIDMKKEGYIKSGRTAGLVDGVIPSDKVGVTLKAECNGKVVDRNTFTKKVKETGQTLSVNKWIGGMPADSTCTITATLSNGNKDSVTVETP